MVIYQESQRFNVIWIIAIVCSLAILAVYAFVQQIVLNEPFGQHPISDGGLVFFTILTIAAALIIIFQKLETQITDKGVYFQLIPFQWRRRFIPWENIDRVELVTYDAYKEYAGYGYRVSVRGNGRAIIISGNSGLMLYRKNKKPLLIGTQNSKGLLEKLSEIKSMV